MSYARETINELNALSKKVFGTTSKWKKMIEQGVLELVEEDVKKLQIKDGKEVIETVKEPVYFTGKNNNTEMLQHRLHRYTVDEVREFMLMVLNRRAQVQETIKKIEEQQKAKEDLKRAVVDATSGSAV